MAGRSRRSIWGGASNPHLIDDDEELDDAETRNRQIEQEAETGRRLAELAAASFNNNIADDDGRASPDSGSDLDQEEWIEEALEGDIAEIIDLTDDDDDASRILIDTLGIREEEHHLGSYRLPSGDKVQAGMTVELGNAHGPHGIQFLRVKAIVRVGWDTEIKIRGLGFKRTREWNGMLPPKLNEVAMVAELRSWTRQQWQEQALVDVEASKIQRVRHLRITNAPFPEHRFEHSEYSDQGKEWVEDNSLLVCRFRYDIHYHANSEKPYEWALIKISEGEADADYRIPDEQNLNRWRGGKVLGGSHNPHGFSQPVIDLDQPSVTAQAPSLSPGQRYTAGDVFAGAGGASRGIERAGLKLEFAVDNWELAVRSMKSNFPQTQIYDMNVYNFITSDDTRRDVDILHLSPPCQFWSPAHTVAGRNDEQNQAVLFSCTDLIAKFRPRLFTVEQTFGLLSPKFTQFFNTFLNGFTVHGYSVRWKIAPLCNYGVPQLRRRLIMIGSAPGERLPPFPLPTHSQDGTGGLKPWATPQSALAHIHLRLNHPLHQRRRPGGKPFVPKAPWDPTRLARTITCSGGQNYHWSGKRDFTLLEYAVLQGFPTWHRFEGSYIKKQIGNAFAPSVVKILYDHLVDWLLTEDGFDKAARQAVRAEIPPDLAPEDFVDLVDSDGDDDDGEELYSPANHVDLTGEDRVDGPEVIFLRSRSVSRAPELQPLPDRRAAEEEDVIVLRSRSVSRAPQPQPARRAVRPRGLSSSLVTLVDLAGGDGDVQMQDSGELSRGRSSVSRAAQQAAVSRNLSSPQGGFVDLAGDDDVQMQEATIAADMRRLTESVEQLNRDVRRLGVQADIYSGSQRDCGQQMEGVVDGGFARERVSVRPVDRTASYAEVQAAGHTASVRNSNEGLGVFIPVVFPMGSEDIQRLGRAASYVEAQAARYSASHQVNRQGVLGFGLGSSRGMDGAVWDPNRASREVDVDMADVEGLSDTETLRDGDVGRRGSDGYRGTPDDPVVLSDGE